MSGLLEIDKEKERIVHLLNEEGIAISQVRLINFLEKKEN